MNNPHPDSPEDILVSLSKTLHDGGINHAEALAKLDEYYTNKFLEIVGEDIVIDPKVLRVLQVEKMAINTHKAELRQAIKNLNKTK